MTTAQFFAKFDLFAGAPDAMAKMRQFILWSAFSGAFSEGERSQPMPDSWARDNSPDLPPIPASWKWQRGSEVFDVIRGVSYKKSDATASPTRGSFPLLRANNIGNGINFDELVYVPRANIRDEQFVRVGDILIAMSSGSKKLVGKAAPIATEFEGAFGAFCGVIRNKSEIPNEVLARYFQSPQYTSWVTAAGRGIGINNLGKSDLDSLPIPMPPLAEQKRIVAKVDELMALCDQLEAQQLERESKHTALAQATLARFAEAPTPINLKLLFHSCFSIQPSDLRKTILKLAMYGQLGAHTQIKTVRLDSLGSWAQGCGFPVAEQGHKDRPILFSKVSDMNLPGNEREIKTTNNTIDDKTAKRLRIKVHPKGAVIFPKIGGAIATNKRRILTQPTAIDNNCSGIIPNETCSTEWLYLVLSGIDFAQYQTGTSVPAVNQGALGEIPVALPPLAEQKRIVAKVEELMALVDALEAQQAAADQAATHLLDAVVSELAAA